MIDPIDTGSTSGARTGRETEVVVAGAGPVGLTLGCLLADQGVDVVVLEAAPACADEPRAITLVDESLRTLQSLGLVQEILPDVVWNTGSAYFGATGRPLVVVEPAMQRLGFPQKSFFDQPGLQRALLKGARARGHVRVEFDSRVTGFEQHEDHITITCSHDGTVSRLRAQFLVGCDGGRSVVRAGAGIAMVGSSQTEKWIVLDLANDPHRERMAMFHCSPARPHVIVPGTNGRCRYEFMLLAGEDPDDVLRHEFIADLVGPYRPLAESDVRRKAVYVAHQVVAERWRERRVLLAGDAAHLMPPFAGQGLNTGLRDARNLAWKLAAVVRGVATDDLLDSYEVERSGHARAMVDLSHRMGQLIMTTDVRRARLRDTLFRATGIVPPVKQYFAAMKFVKRPRILDGFVAPSGDSDLTGTYLPQPVVADSRGSRALLDERLGRGWSLLRIGPPCEIPAQVVETFSARTLSVVSAARIPQSDGGPVEELCDTEALLPVSAQTRYLLIRPDRVIAADFAAGDEARVLRALSSYRVPNTLTSQNQGGS